MMRFSPAPIFLLALLFAAAIPALTLGANLTQEGFLYNIAVDQDGNAQVEISYHDSAISGSMGAWVAVPARRVTNWTYNCSGDASFNRTSIDFFYDNLSFTYSGEVEVTVEYNFSRASMIVEPDAFFMSPMILFSPVKRGEGHVSLSRVDRPIKPSDVAPPPSHTSTDRDRVEMVFSLDRSVQRITVYYVVTGQLQLQSAVVGKYTGFTPSRYAQIMDSILQLYSKNEEKLEDLFHTQVGNVTVRFFSPKPDQIDIEGYTPFNASQMGDIFMNLFYTRFIPGYFEQASLHELVHHYLLASGIEPQTLWIQEGAANFFSTQLTMDEGYAGAEIFRDNVAQIDRAKLKGNYGFIENWRPESASRDLSYYYAASYKVFDALNATYGFDIFNRFFRLLSESAEKSVDSKEAIRLLSIAAAENLNPLFSSMGFRDLPDLSDLSLTRTATRIDLANQSSSYLQPSPLSRFVVAAVLLVLIAVVVVLASVSTRRALGDRQRSPLLHYGDASNREANWEDRPLHG